MARLRDLISIIEAITQSHFYAGTCVNSFDSDGDCTVSVLPWATVSDFALADENAREINHEQYLSMGGQDVPETAGHECRYLLTDDDVLMLYDADTDVHYFFAR